MNMFYTGLGIARSLGEQGIPVIGLSAHQRIFGNFTRYAKVRACPDSRSQPELLLPYLLEMAREIGSGSVIFPTRDDDVLFLDRYRAELSPHYVLAIPGQEPIEICLDKWKTYLGAQQAGVPQPKSWLIDSEEALLAVAERCSFPCVLKPVASHHWRQGQNWDIVGGRKAIRVESRAQLLSEYAVVNHADRRALLQELVPGGDDCLAIAACYLDRNSKWVAGFNTRKLLQVPEAFGTGCIVESYRNPELLERSARLLQAIRFTGIAEVEYKWDARTSDYQLIEINARPWDQHRLGNATGVDLIRLAFAELSGAEAAIPALHTGDYKWIAEDTLCMELLRLIRDRNPKVRQILRLASGKRIYAIWSLKDPLPFLVYMLTSFLPNLMGSVFRALRPGRWYKFDSNGDVGYERHLEQGRGHD